MTLYVRIEGGRVVEGPDDLPRARDNVSGFHLLPLEDLRARGWLPVEFIKDDFDPDTETLQDPAFNILADKVQATYSKRALTGDESKNNARSKIVGAGQDISLVLVEMAEKLLADGVIAPTDFSPDVRQAWQRVKGYADTIRS